MTTAFLFTGSSSFCFSSVGCFLVISSLFGFLLSSIGSSSFGFSSVGCFLVISSLFGFLLSSIGSSSFGFIIFFPLRTLFSGSSGSSGFSSLGFLSSSIGSSGFSSSLDIFLDLFSFWLLSSFYFLLLFFFTSS